VVEGCGGGTKNLLLQLAVEENVDGSPTRVVKAAAKGGNKVARMVGSNIMAGILYDAVCCIGQLAMNTK